MRKLVFFSFENGYSEEGDDDNDGKYVGEFKDGTFHGQGTLTWKDGKKYEGEWKNNKPWNGILFDKKGNINMKWVNGKKQ